MKLNRKGYTLIELLAVILIIGLILGFSTYGIINAFNTSKNKSLTISINSIKEAAETYATEKNDDSSYWLDITDKDITDKDTTYKENKYFCITIEELMNKGLLDKKANIKSKDFDIHSYVLVKKNKVTMVNSKAEILTKDKVNSDGYKVCMGNIVNKEVTVYPKLDNGTSYTDEISVEFSDATTNQSSTMSDKVCMYGDSSANIKETGVIEGNTCKLQGLKQNEKYYLRVCMKTSRESYLCSNTESRNTKVIKKPTYTLSSNTLTIKYNNANINGEAKYYFKSTVKGTSNINVNRCTISNNIFTCDRSTTTNIEKDTWYQSSSNQINISYTTTGKAKVTARTVDKSNNYSESTKDFTINKYTITFIKEPADKIGGGTINIAKSCYAISGQNCSITSPTIERKGYSIVGWNTTKDATKSTWNANTSKNISSSATYYPITKTYIVTIKFSTNNGSLTSPTVSSTGNTYKWRENYGIIERTNANGSTYSDSFFKINYNSSTASDGLPNYNYSKYLKITKTGYSAVFKEEWKCKSGCTTSGKTYDQSVAYKANDFCDATSKDCTVVLGVNWKINTYTITYNANGGNESNQTQEVKYGETWTTKDKIFTKTGYTQVGWNTKADGSGTTYSLKKLQKAKKEGNLTLYAKWKVNTYTITYNANGGTGVPSSQTKTYGKSLTLSSTKPTRTGYTFLGWATSSSATKATYTAGGKYTANSDATLYAVWKDTTPPTMDWGPSTGTTWCTGKEVWVKCSDNGSGMKETYMNDNGTVTTGTTTTSQGMSTRSGNKRTYLKCTDKAGNVTEKTIWNYYVKDRYCTDIYYCRRAEFGCEIYNAKAASPCSCKNYTYSDWKADYTSKYTLSESACKAKNKQEDLQRVICTYKQRTCNCGHWSRTKTCISWNICRSSAFGCQTYNQGNCGCNSYSCSY